MTPELLSIELTRRCAKACSFCYNASGPNERDEWPAGDVVAFVKDCAARGTKAVSFGGGEPLEYGPLGDVLAALDGVVFRSVTTNGLLLDERLDALVSARPDKVHVSIHFPERPSEVARVIRQVSLLAERGVRSGVNLLVARGNLAAAARAATTVRDAGIPNDRVVYLPMRGRATPSPREVAAAAGGGAFQSTTCLPACGKSSRFVSLGADRSVGWCSYTASRRPLATPTHAALLQALEGLPLAYCGGIE